MIRWKFWHKQSGVKQEEVAAVIEAADSWPSLDLGSHDSIDFFWGFAEADEEFDTEWEPPTPMDLVFIDYGYSSPDDLKQFTDFSEWKERKPIPPRSALLAPPRLTQSEHKAVEFQDVIKQNFVTGEIKIVLKPALQKKLREVAKGYRRVTFDDKGKMKEVKTTR